MKQKLLLLGLMLTAVFSASAQEIKTYSSCDTNTDESVTITDVTNTANKVLGKVASEQNVVTATDLNSVLTNIYSKLDSHSEELRILKLCLSSIAEKVGAKTPDEIEMDEKNLLPGKFSVSATKQVQFTKSNLYWDGSAFKFEANQTDYQTSWDANHVSHFYWTNLTEYQSGNASYMPYAESYSCSSQSTSDKFWCGEDNPLTVEGTSGLYALTGDDDGEWNYLINKRSNASSLSKYGVTVTNGGTSYTNCLIIAPDDFSGTLASNYTLDEVNNLGLVCLPAAGRRSGSSFYIGGSYGSYWSATPSLGGSGCAYSLGFENDYVNPANYLLCDTGYSLRLVRGL